MKDLDQQNTAPETGTEPNQQQEEGPKKSKFKQVLGLQDADGPISDRKEKRINRAVAKAVERDLSDKVTLGERADELMDPTKKERQQLEERDRVELIDKIFAGNPGAETLSDKQKERFVNAAVDRALIAVAAAGPYETEVDYRTAVKGALSNLEVEYTHVQTKEEKRKRGDNETKDAYKTYEEDYKAYEKEFNKLNKDTRRETVCITVDLNELGTQRKYDKDGEVKTNGKGEAKEEKPLYHQADESFLQQRGFKVAATAIEGVVAFFGSPVAAVALAAGIKSARKTSELGGDNYAHGDELEFKKMRSVIEGVTPADKEALEKGLEGVKKGLQELQNKGSEKPISISPKGRE